jgi:parallel beta-helix repeat protein
MKKQVQKILQYAMMLGCMIAYATGVHAIQLSGTYTIDSSATPSATVFRNLNSAITYMTSGNTRSDGGPSNTAPFGVSGDVTFNYVANTGPYVEQVVIPVIPGAGPSARITINGNGNTVQFACNTTERWVIQLNGADFVTIKNLTIRTTDLTFGWGIHFWNGADNNIVDSCIIDITTVTSTLAANSAGIVFSASTTSPTSSGVNGYFNTISNCQINGNPTGGGMYYGIVGLPATSGTIISQNRFINNTIRNFFHSGIYWGNSNGAVFRNNLITRTTKTSLTTTYGFNLNNGSRRDTFDGNIITGCFNGSPTTTLQFFAFYAINYSGTTAEQNVFMNNAVYDNKGSGAHYGFYLLSSTNNRFYNNTISLDNTAAPFASEIAAVYSNSSTSAFAQLDFRNNIFNITQGGTGNKFMYLILGSLISGTTLNANAYFSNATNYNLASNSGVIYPTLAAWRAFMGPAQEQKSGEVNPLFTNLLTGDLRPRDTWFQANSDTIAGVNTFLNGTPRTLPTIIGAYALNALSLDVAMGQIITPVTPYAAGPQSFSAVIRNAGLTTITSATINWTVNGVPQTAVPFTGTLTSGQVSAPIVLGTASVPVGQVVQIVATVSNPNGVADGNTTNNSASATTAAQLPGGVYTINQTAVASPTNFTSFNQLANLFSIGGIGGAITINVVPNTGPYTERVIFNTVAGASSTNNITINGNGNTVQFNNDNTIIGVINLIGVDHFRFNNLNVTTLNTNWGVGYLFTAGSDTNTVENCIINVSSVSNSSASAGIAVTGSLTTPLSTLANTGFANHFIGNTILGSSDGGPWYGIVIAPTNTSFGANMGYVIQNNTISDFTSAGIYMTQTAGTIVRGNRISRPLRNNNTTSTVYGIYLVNGSQQDTIENNIIENLHGGPAQLTGTATTYGIAIQTTNTQAARRTIVRNNVVTGLRNNGVNHGIWLSTVSNTMILHNTVSINHPTSTSASASSAFFHTGTVTGSNFLFIQNNIFDINRGGSGVTTAIHINNVSTNIVVGGNAYNVDVAPLSTNNNIGFYNGAVRPTFTDWQTAVSFDTTSIAANPLFRTWNTQAPFTPGSPSLNNVGNNILAFVPNDILGNPRTSTPDIGAYEFFVPAVDIGITRLVQPNPPVGAVFATLPIDVELRNFGLVPITSADINWMIDTALQTPISWVGFLSPNDTITAPIGVFTIPATGSYMIKIWTSNPNGTTDSIPLNDTLVFTIGTPLSGTVTLDPGLPASTTNYTSIQSLMADIAQKSLGGDLTVLVAPGTYTGSISFTGPIFGASASSRLIFEGTDSTLVTFTHNGVGNRPTLLIDNARNLVFRNIRFVTTGITAGTAVQLINAADSNTFIRCSFIAPYNTSTAVSPFIASGSLTSLFTQGNSANHTLIDSCTATGGAYAISFMGINTQKSRKNIIRNSLIINSHSYGVYLNEQDSVVLLGNRIYSIGVLGNNTFAFGAFLTNSVGGCRIMNNDVQDMIAGTGIQFTFNLGTPTNPIVVANNMVNIGRSTNTNQNTGIDENNNGNIDIAYNAVRILTSESSYASAAWRFNNTNPGLYNNVRVVNNIFIGAFGGMSVYCLSNVNLFAANYTINNNVYFSTNSFPWRTGGFITNTLPAFATGVNMLGSLPGNNTNSQFFSPVFLGPNNLRSRSVELDDSGTVVPSVTFDFDFVPRNPVRVDIGLIEFDRPANDAGVVAFLEPQIPVALGLKDVGVIIRNFGTAPILDVDVTYAVDTVIHTLSYVGNIPPGNVDTVFFDSTSGPLFSDQRFLFNGGGATIKAWTSLPNGVVDSLATNDTLSYSFCTPLVGTYTINPFGSGPTNFVSINDAISNLICGGVLGPVVFELATGTYTGQFTLPTIIGTSALNTITFTSAARNRDSVLITTSISTANDNYTFRLVGATHINFEDLTFENTNASFGRVMHIVKDAVTNIMADNITTLRCRFNGIANATTSDVFTLYNVQNGDDNKNQVIKHSEFNNGSNGVFLGGQNIVNQSAIGSTVDSNVFVNQTWNAISMSNRFFCNIRGNSITHLPTINQISGIQLNTVGDESFIENNTIIKPAGTNGINIALNAYYARQGITNVRNNIIEMTNTGNVTNYGIFVTSSSQLRIANNTVRLQSIAPSSSAFYNSGNGTFVVGVTTYPASNDIRVFNNIFIADQGYLINSVNVLANASMPEVNHNLYFNTNPSQAFLISPTTYTPAQFATAYRNSIYSGSDTRSLFANLQFSGTTPGLPNAAHESVWNINGRGKTDFFLNPDFNGVERSRLIETGTSDIGAYEVVPSANPPRLTVTDSIAYGSIQYIREGADTVGAIEWSFSGTLPDSISARKFPGSFVRHRDVFSIDTIYTSLDDYIRIEAFGGSGYLYDFTYYYNPMLLGTVPSESDIRMAKRADGIWQTYPSTLTQLDTVNKRFKVFGLFEFGDFTGTDELSPLPITLTRFDARAMGRDAELSWTTGSEINSSHFVIERSIDNINYSAVGRVRSNGISSRSINYQFVDENVAQNTGSTTVFYRLRAVDVDGSFSISPIRRVSFLQDLGKGAVVAYPNPFTQTVNIAIESQLITSGDIIVYDIYGRLVAQQSINLIEGTNTVELKQLQSTDAGVYFVKIVDASGERTLRIIKE